MSIYDDIAGVAAVTIPEGSVVKITRKSDGAVVWEKPGFVWKKYNTVETVTYVEKSEDTEIYLQSTAAITAYEQKTFDTDTGEIKLTGSYKRLSGNNAYSTAYPYFIRTDNVYKSTGSKGYDSQAYAYVYTVLRYYAEKVTTYSQGAYIEDVTSLDENAYPENGQHTDGYWYVKQ